MDLNKPLRMQVALTTEDGTVLQAEVIGEFHMFDAFQPGGGYWERFAKAKYHAGKPCGGAAIQLADKPRIWDIPVGGKL